MRFVIISILRREFGEMAFNLAVSLRSALPACEITVISDGTFEAIKGAEAYVNEIIPTTSKNPFRIKANLYSIVKHKDCMYIDADSLVNNPDAFRKAIEQLKEQPLYIQRYRNDIEPGDTHGPETWGNVHDFAAHYGFVYSYPVYNSTVIRWKRSREIGAWFKKVAAFYDNPPQLDEQILGKTPDEVAFGAASAVLGTKPILMNRVTWFRWETEHFRTFPLISLAGANIPNVAIMRYNALVKDNAKAARLQAYEINQKYKRGRI